MQITQNLKTSVRTPGRILGGRHRLFTCLSALSLLIFLAAVGLWIRSHSQGDLVTYGARWDDRGTNQIKGLTGWSGGGGFYVAYLHVAATPLKGQVGPFWPWRLRWETKPNPLYTKPGNPMFDRFGFCWKGRWRQPANDRNFNRILSEFYLAAPHWSVALLSAILPALWLVGLKRRLRSVQGLCPICGYDLRASPDRCPECGNAVAMPPNQTTRRSRQPPCPSRPA